MSRIRDGKQYETPRELIQLFNAARDVQMRSFEIGEQPDGDALFTGDSFKQGLKTVSDRRLYQTVYAEYPALKQYIEMLRSEKSEYTFETLKALWPPIEPNAQKIIDKLPNIGFFERRVDKTGEVSYWVPFLYRDALQLLLGKSD